METENRIPIRLERSTLFVPATRWPMIEKAAASPSDAVCLDLEDSVAPDEKAASRGNVIRAFTELDFGRRTRIFRINALEGPFAYRDLIEVVEAAGEHIDVVMIPKTGSKEDVAFVDRLLTQLELHCALSRRIGIAAQIETAAAFLAIREIARSSPRLEALIFGPLDYAASMQMPTTGTGEADRHDGIYPGHRWHAVMHSIVAASRANGLRCVDGPYAAYQNTAGLERSCSIARAMGFDGKQCIHPSQLPATNAIFSPARDEVAYAEEVVQAYQRAVAAKNGAVSLHGKMIDMASVRIAQSLLKKKELIERQIE